MFYVPCTIQDTQSLWTMNAMHQIDICLFRPLES